MALPPRTMIGAGAVIVLAAVSLGLGIGRDRNSAPPASTGVPAVAHPAQEQPVPGSHPAASVAQLDTSQEMIVYKTPTCGCCGLWEDRMREAGFRVVSRDTSDVGPVKRRLGLPPALESCHTAVIAGYVVEGHVPASAVSRLLQERPAVVGIAVPGMPMGSPGMDTGPRKDPYDVVTFDRAGRTTVYSSH